MAYPKLSQSGALVETGLLARTATQRYAFLESMRDGYYLQGLTAPLTANDLQYCSTQLAGKAGSAGGNVALLQYSTDASCSFLGHFKARGTKTAPLAVIAGDDLGEWQTQAWDGTNWLKTAIMTPYVDGAVSAGVVPTAMRWWTKGSGALTLGVTLSSAQLLTAHAGFVAERGDGLTAILAKVVGASNGGPEIRVHNGYNATLPIYGFLGNNNSGVGNSAANVLTLITGSTVRLQVNSTGQISIGTIAPDAAAKVQIDSTTQGFLLPRMTTAQRDAISAPPDGLMIHNTTIPAIQGRVSGAWVSL